MINNEEFTKRLQKIFDHYDVNASSFAEKIKVGKASISHLLSGRNNPSLDFVMRVIKAYPDVDLYWLINGTGTFPKRVKPPEITNQSIKPSPVQNTLFDEEKKEKTDISEDNDMIRNFSTSNEIERIVIFYKNGKFKSYSSV